ncbi:hypothetical protein WJX74_003703 [Apatococcus lobatus]|uniref:RNA exonuclease 4 n=1 Tax=Apatococcus lobatus TaxID=904363 RepID=A0AAW1RF07_9CHLO
MKKPNKFKTEEFLSSKQVELSKKPRLSEKEQRLLAQATVQLVEPDGQDLLGAGQAASQTARKSQLKRKRKRSEASRDDTSLLPPASQRPVRDSAAFPPKRQKLESAQPEKAALPAREALPTKKLKLKLPQTMRPADGTINPNWQALQSKLQVGPRKRQKTEAAAPPGRKAKELLKGPVQLKDSTAVTQVLAVDCEMVGVGPDGARSALARVCIVNNLGTVLLDKHVQPSERVTDFRTKYSGIRPADLKDAESLEDVAAEVAKLVEGRILVGHAITNDLQVLLLGHPRRLIRDTAFYPPLMRKVGPTGRLKPQALRNLAAAQLGLAIQAGEHSPVDDARATLYLYHRHRKDWEHSLQHASKHPPMSAPASTGQPVKSSKQTQGLDMSLALEMADL